MNGLTSEGAVTAVGNRYDLVLIATRRTRELRNGWAPHITTKTGALVTALAEIEAGKIGREYLLKPLDIDRRERPPTHD